MYSVNSLVRIMNDEYLRGSLEVTNMTGKMRKNKFRVGTSCQI